MVQIVGLNPALDLLHILILTAELDFLGQKEEIHFFEKVYLTMFPLMHRARLLSNVAFI